MSAKTKTILALILFSIVDLVTPVPILGLVLIYVVLQRPSWFTDLVDKIYGTGASN